MTRFRVLSLLLLFTAADTVLGGVLPNVAGPLRQFDIVRQALRDELWSIAARHADQAAQEERRAVEARLAKLEALAGAGKYDDMLRALDAWQDVHEAFRYWRAWALVAQNRRDEAATLLAKPFSSPRLQVLALRLKARQLAHAGAWAAADDMFREAARAVGTNALWRAENALEWAQAIQQNPTGDGVGAALDVLASAKVDKAAEAAGVPGEMVRLEQARLLALKGVAVKAEAIRRELVACGTNTDERVFVAAACELARTCPDAAEARAFASKAVARARQGELRRVAGCRLGILELDDSAADVRARGRQRIRALVREFPTDEESRTAQLLLADKLLMKGEAEAAEAEYRVYLEVYPEAAFAGDAHVLEGRAWALDKLGRRTEAIGAFQRAAQVATNSEVKARCQFKQAEALVAEARYAQAAEVFGGLSKTGGDWGARAQFAQADALTRAGQDEAAEKVFAALAAGTDPLGDEAAWRLAVRKAEKGRSAEAVAAYSQLLARPTLTPDLRVRAYVGRGKARCRTAEWQAASDDFAVAAKLAPARREEMAFFRAICLQGEGRESEAKAGVVELLAEVREGPLWADLVFWLAKYDARHGNWLSAETGFEDYARVSTNRPVAAAAALVRAARAAGARTDYAKAVEYVSRAQKLAPKAPFLPDALVVQGEALMVLARYDDALLVLERALEMAPGSEAAFRAAELKADALYSMGAGDASRYEEALKAYQALEGLRHVRAQSVTPSAQIGVSFKIARTLEKLHRTEEAMDQYYSKVVLFYEASRRGGLWLDDAAGASFVRAAMTLANHYEETGRTGAALGVWRIVAAAGVSASDEARRRIGELKAKGAGK